MTEKHKRIVILDRDGVINQDSAHFIKSPAEWIAIPNSLEAIKKLNDHHVTVVIASNQSGLARGLFDLNTLHQIHEKMRHQLLALKAKVDGIYFCPHGPDDNCHCRKPKTGLLEKVASDFQVNLQNAPFVGDALRDLQSAHAMKCQPILVTTGKGASTLAKGNLPDKTRIYNDLMAFVEAFVSTPNDFALAT